MLTGVSRDSLGGDDLRQDGIPCFCEFRHDPVRVCLLFVEGHRGLITSDIKVVGYPRFQDPVDGFQDITYPVRRIPSAARWDIREIHVNGSCRRSLQGRMQGREKKKACKQNKQRNFYVFHGTSFCIVV